MDRNRWISMNRSHRNRRNIESSESPKSSKSSKSSKSPRSSQSSKQKKIKWKSGHARVDICAKLRKSFKSKTKILLNYLYYYYSLKQLIFCSSKEMLRLRSNDYGFNQHLHASILASHTYNEKFTSTDMMHFRIFPSLRN